MPSGLKLINIFSLNLIQNGQKEYENGAEKGTSGFENGYESVRERVREWHRAWHLTGNEIWFEWIININIDLIFYGEDSPISKVIFMHFFSCINQSC